MLTGETISGKLNIKGMKPLISPTIWIWTAI